MKKRDSLLLTVFLLFFLSLFLDRFITAYTVGMCVLAAAALAHGSFTEKIQLLKRRKYIWFMLAFAAMLVISFLVSENKGLGMQYLQRRIPLLLFPISIGLLEISKKSRDKILLGLAIIVTAMCLCSLGWAFYKFQQEHNSAWLYNDALSYLVGQQSIYTSVLVNISIYIFVYFLLNYQLSGRHKILFGAGIAFLFIISYLLASRNMMLILYATILLFAFYITFKKKKYWLGASLLSAILIVVILIFAFFPKTINRFKELAFTQFNYESRAKESHYAGTLTPDQWNGANFRLAAWPCGWQLFKEHPVAGVGLGDKKDKLVKVYEQKKFQFAITTGKNVHNNYLDILMSMGVIGFVLFLLGWILLPLFQIIRTGDQLGLLILITFILAMITENYFDRSIGAMLFGFFVPFLLSTTNKEIENSPIP
ncbi:MAG: O-antigen ligase family protein [Chitinophagaceae bacterium]